MPIREPFPVRRQGPGQVAPGSVKGRTFRTSGRDSYTGPSYGERRGNTDVQGATRSVKRFGVDAHNRGEWKR